MVTYKSKIRVIESFFNELFVFNHVRSKAEKLADKLRAARTEQEKLEDNYRAELKAQTKLVELYKQHGEENTGKTEELSRAVTDLQQLLKDSADRYGKLETQMEALKAEHSEELASKVETVKALRKELDEANKLLKTFKDKGLTEDGIECLSPSAAQASRLLKSGITLTGIYSQMVAISEELAQEKEENKRLNSYMDQILLEIEERAPILRQQRENYEMAMATVGKRIDRREIAMLNFCYVNIGVVDPGPNWIRFHFSGPLFIRIANMDPHM